MVKMVKKGQNGPDESNSKMMNHGRMDRKTVRTALEVMGTMEVEEKNKSKKICRDIFQVS